MCQLFLPPLDHITGVYMFSFTSFFTIIVILFYDLEFEIVQVLFMPFFYETVVYLCNGPLRMKCCIYKQTNVFLVFMADRNVMKY